MIIDYHLMNKSFRHIQQLLMLWLLLQPLTAGAQPLRAIHTHLSTKDGLCSNAISAIRQDDFGYIWIATWNGLSRYDGYEFYNYRMGSGSGVKHLHNRLLDIRIDQFQNVWMHMYDNRVFVLNRHTDKIINPFEGKVGYEEFLLGSRILTTSKGDVLLNIRDVGLFVAVLDPNNGLKSAMVDTHGMKIGCMAEGVDDDVWLGTTQGIYRGIRKTMALDTLSILTHEEVTALCVNAYSLYAATKQGAIYRITFPTKIQQIRKPTGKTVFNMFFDSHGLLWFCDDQMGASYLNIETGKEKHFQQFVPVPERDGRGGEFNEVNDRVWILMNNGGYGYYNREADCVEHFYNDPMEPWNISNTVYASLEMPEGVVWESTSSRGLDKLELQKNNIVRRKPIPNATSTEENEIRAMYYDKDRKLLLLGNKRSSLFLYHDNGQKSVITHDSKGNPLGRLYGISKDSQGNYWICSKDNGVYKMSPNGSGWALKNYRHEEGNPMSMSSSAAYEAVEDKDGNIWIATYGGGVNLLTKENMAKDVFLHPLHGMADYPERAFQKVRTIEADPDGKVWAGTTDGILELSYVNKKVMVKELEMSTETGSAPLSIDIICIRRDNKGAMWVGTNGGGIAHTHNKDKNGRWEMHIFDAGNGLPSEEIRSITFDENGNTWFAAEHIICSFNAEKHIFTSFAELDGLDDTRISEGGAIMTGNGNILFGTLDGYYEVDRQKLMASDGALLKLQITGFLLSDEWQSPRLGSKIDYYVPGSTHVRVPSGASNFGFRFAAMNYQLQHRVHYQYMLEGYDKDWRNAEKDRTATYFDVPSGTYVFKVKAFLLESPDKYDIRSIEVDVRSALPLGPLFKWVVGIMLLLLIAFFVYKFNKEFKRKIEFPVEKKSGKGDDEDSYEIIDVDKLSEEEQ